MKGYNSKEAMAGHEYNMSKKHRMRESEGMKKYWDRKEGRKDYSNDDGVMRHNNKRMYSVNTMSEDYDVNRVKVIPFNLRGDPPEAYDYEF